MINLKQKEAQTRLIINTGLWEMKQTQQGPVYAIGYDSIIQRSRQTTRDYFFS